MAATMDLSLKQARFVAVYIGPANGNATEAARLAGYRGNRTTLEVVGRENLGKPRIAAAIAEYRVAIKAEGIANKQNRIDRLNADWLRLQQVIAERAADPTMADVPGGTTGLLVRTVKALGHGADARIVEEYAVDTGLLRELRAHEEQAAKELGQWTEKRELTGKDGGAIVVRSEPDLSALTVEELRELERLTQRALGPAAPLEVDPNQVAQEVGPVVPLRGRWLPMLGDA